MSQSQTSNNQSAVDRNNVNKFEMQLKDMVLNEIEEKENEYIFDNSEDGRWMDLYPVQEEPDIILGECYEIKHTLNPKVGNDGMQP